MVVRIIKLAIFQVCLGDVHVDITALLATNTVEFRGDTECKLVEINTFHQSMRRVEVGKHRVQIDMQWIISPKIEVDFPQQPLECL